MLAAAVIVDVLFSNDVFTPGSIDKVFQIFQLNDVIAVAVAILGLNLVPVMAPRRATKP